LRKPVATKGIPNKEGREPGSEDSQQVVIRQASEPFPADFGSKQQYVATSADRDKSAADAELLKPLWMLSQIVFYVGGSDNLVVGFSRSPVMNFKANSNV
jgi:hypothetical protein